MPGGRDGFIPPFMDIQTLCKHVCCSERAIEQWIELGQFPPPVKTLGTKKIWSWREVEEHLARHPVSSDNGDRLGAEIRQAAKDAHRR